LEPGTVVKPENVYLRQILFEMRKQGNVVRVAAIDPDSNTEVVIVGDPRQGETALKRLAERKLRYVMAKKGIGAKRDPWEGL
jgi:hypothetical protein